MLNRSNARALAGGMTPYEALNKAHDPDSEEYQKPNVSNMRVFGCRAYVSVPKEKRTQSEKFVPPNLALQ